MRGLMRVYVAVSLLLAAGCAQPQPFDQAPERLASCGAIGNKGLQIFEVCGVLNPEDKKIVEISTSECGVIRLARKERAYLCQGIKTLHNNLPNLNRADPIPSDPTTQRTTAYGEDDVALP